MSMPKEVLHQLVDKLSESDITAAERYLSYLIAESKRRFIEALNNATEEDETLSEQEKLALGSFLESEEEGHTKPWEAVKKELGLRG